MLQVWTLLKRSEKEGGYRWILFIARVGYVALHVAPIASARIWKGKTKILILLKKELSDTMIRGALTGVLRSP